jgi:hypothetical protein
MRVSPENRGNIEVKAMKNGDIFIKYLDEILKIAFCKIRR